MLYVGVCFHVADVSFLPRKNSVCVLKRNKDMSNHKTTLGSTTCFKTLMTNGTSAPYNKKRKALLFCTGIQGQGKEKFIIEETEIHQ